MRLSPVPIRGGPSQLLPGYMGRLLCVASMLGATALIPSTAPAQSTTDPILEAQNALIPSPIRRGLLFGVDVPQGAMAAHYRRGMSTTAWVALLETREPVNLRLELTYNELEQDGRTGTPMQLRMLGTGAGFMWVLHTPTRWLLPYTGLMATIALSKQYYGSEGAADVEAFPFSGNPQFGGGILLGAFVRGPHISLIEVDLPFVVETRAQLLGNRVVTAAGVGLHF